jgi:hypothetical protein
MIFSASLRIPRFHCSGWYLYGTSYSTRSIWCGLRNSYISNCLEREDDWDCNSVNLKSTSTLSCVTDNQTYNSLPTISSSICLPHKLPSTRPLSAHPFVPHTQSIFCMGSSSKSWIKGPLTLWHSPRGPQASRKNPGRTLCRQGLHYWSWCYWPLYWNAAEKCRNYWRRHLRR